MAEITETQRAFLNQLTADIEGYLLLPLNAGGPYRTDLKGLHSWFRLWKASRDSHGWYEQTNEGWYLFEPLYFPQEGLFLPEKVPYLPKYTGDRKFTFLYWYLVKVKGYELCVLTQTFEVKSRETMAIGPAPRKYSTQGLYVKVP